MNKPLTVTSLLDLVRRLVLVETGSTPHTWPAGLCIVEGRSDLAPTKLDADGWCPACKVVSEADTALRHAESLATEDPCPPAILKRRGKLSAPELASLVGCDLKTVHNHVRTHKLMAAHTPGTHLRFTAPIARDYMRRQGASVPAWLEALASGEAASS